MPESELIRKIRERAERSDKNKVILPKNFISWEYGSNKYASQKGTGGFNQIRNTTLNVQSSREWVNTTHEVPFYMCPPLKKQYASQSGQPLFGTFRDNLIYVQEHNDEKKKKVNDLLVDSTATSRILPRWSKPNSEAKNDQIGAKRQTVMHTVDSSRPLTKQERLKCQAVVPRFQCINETVAAKDAVATGNKLTAMGLHSHRQIITNVSGADRTEQDQLDSNRYMAWLGGQLTLQSQAQTAGFMKKRDVANVSYYDKLITDAAQRLQLEQLRENKQELQTGGEPPEQSAESTSSNVGLLSKTLNK